MSLAGNWKAEYKFDANQGIESNKPQAFTCRLSMHEELLTGEFYEGMKLGKGSIKGQCSGNKVYFEKQYARYNDSGEREDPPPAHYDGILSADGTLAGTWQMVSAGQQYTGTWTASPYSPSKFEQFFDLERRVSLVIFLITMIAGYYGIFRPLAAARSGAQILSIWPLMMILFAAGVPFSLYGVIMGERGTRFLEDNVLNKVSAKGACFFVVIGIAAAAIWFYVESQVRSLGYH